MVNYTVDKTGKLVDINAQKSLGAGCEYEAVKVISMSPKWTPGLQNGHPVKVHYSAEVNFTKTKRRITFKELKESSYGFVFQLGDSLYTIDEAEAQLGDSFKQNKLEGTELFYNPDNIQKFNIPDKKEVYLLKIKS
ncbi:MAG: energy transducer TonB [Mucilaginibacter sp.]